MKLPVPEATARLHSERLTDYIRKDIERQGAPIDFARFMQLALYTPGLGYYAAGAHKLGKGGDFVTAPEISPLFAECLAAQWQPLLKTLTNPCILEIGAGSGQFASDILHALAKNNSLPDQYLILEVSAELRDRQTHFLQATCPQWFSRIKWLDTLDGQKITGVIFANEVMDALPTHCFCIDQKIIKERVVNWQETQFCWELRAAPHLQQSPALQGLSLPEGYTSEVNLLLAPWIRTLAATLTQGIVLLSDYGYGRAEYYHPDRRHGTLMCYYQHHRHNNPFHSVGLQDITAHVDFTTVAEAATAAGLSLAGYTTQANFLLSCGLLEIVEQQRLSAKEHLIEHYQQNQAIKMLTLPAQMGEAIKMIGLTKEWDPPLKGFSLRDRRHDL